MFEKKVGNLNSRLSNLKQKNSQHSILVLTRQCTEHRLHCAYNNKCRLSLFSSPPWEQASVLTRFSPFFPFSKAHSGAKSRVYNSWYISMEWLFLVLFFYVPLIYWNQGKKRVQSLILLEELSKLYLLQDFALVCKKIGNLKKLARFLSQRVT